MNCLKMNLCVCLRKVGVGLGQEGVVCVRVGETIWDTLKEGKIEKRGGGTKILQRGGGNLGQGRCALKLVSAIFYQIFIFHQMIALQKL